VISQQRAFEGKFIVEILPKTLQILVEELSPMVRNEIIHNNTNGRNKRHDQAFCAEFV